MDDPSGPLLGSIISILVLTLVNAFLAGAEMAFVSLNPAKIKELADKGDKKALRVQRLLKNSDSFLSAIQVGITLAGFFNSAAAAQAFVKLLGPVFGGTAFAHTLATIVVTLGISYIALVLGELYPKQLALQVPEKYAMNSSFAIAFICKLFHPFILLLNFSTGLLKKLTPLDFTKREEKLTRNEMSALLKNSTNDGAIDLDEFNMMKGVLSLDSRQVTEIMVPRVDAYMLDILDDEQENITKLIKQPHSRVPFYEDEKDNVIGVVHIRDAISKLKELRSGKIGLRDIMRPALFIPETLMTDELLLRFKQGGTHMALIVDEFGGFEGLVCLNDLLSEIVGDIPDEYSDEEKEIMPLGEKSFMLAGSLSISDFNEHFSVDIESEEADTLAGFLISKLGFIPQAKEKATLKYKCYVFEVRKVNKTRIELIKMKIVDLKNDDSEQA